MAFKVERRKIKTAPRRNDRKGGSHNVTTGEQRAPRLYKVSEASAARTRDRDLNRVGHSIHRPKTYVSEGGFAMTNYDRFKP